MPIYEYTLGVHVQAKSPAEAWEKVGPLSEKLDELDVEHDSSVEGPTEVDWLYDSDGSKTGLG